MSEPKILVLVLASDTDPLYCAFQIVWREYMNIHPNIDCFFYKGHPDLRTDAFLSDKNTLLVKCNEKLDTCYEKTLRAFTFFRPRFKQYDYIFRTNLSSFIVFDYYLKVASTWPRKEFCSAFIGKTDNEIEFPAGAGFTITPDLVERILDENPPLIVQDDVSIGHFLKKIKVPIHPVERIDILVNEQLPFLAKILSENDEIFHFRIKNIQGNRDLDIQIMIQLLSYYYNK